MKMNKIQIILKVIAIVLLIIAIFPCNYGYYMFLRLVCCGIFAYFTFDYYEKEIEPWIWIFGGLAIVFNPILPLHLGKELWMIVDGISVILIGVSFTSWIENKIE